jgi:hypothetical protein
MRTANRIFDENSHLRGLAPFGLQKSANNKNQPPQAESKEEANAIQRLER